MRTTHGRASQRAISRWETEGGKVLVEPPASNRSTEWRGSSGGDNAEEFPAAADRPARSDIQHGKPMHPGVRIGHVHLKVADLERAVDFYQNVLGFEVTQRLGREAAFLSAGGYHHHIALNTWESAGGSPPPHGTTGLYHVAVLYPTRQELADAFKRLLQAGISLEGASDHGVSEALYLRDPDGNGLELSWDRPQELWPRTEDGRLDMFTKPLPLASLIDSRGKA